MLFASGALHVGNFPVSRFERCGAPVSPRKTVQEQEVFEPGGGRGAIGYRNITLRDWKQNKSRAQQARPDLLRPAAGRQK